MGGARCVYKNCTIRSDGGKTHMFHHPVYDRQRCHQWLVNGRNLDFLDLSVSQLKNRVICEHHFPDDAFMNCLRNKLKHDAVPVLDGPYCDSAEELEEINEKELLESDLTHLFIDDIENEVRLTVNEKKATRVLKYGDFLASNDAEGIITSQSQKAKHVNEDIQTYDLASVLKNNDYFVRETRSMSTQKDNKKITSPKKQNDLVTIEIAPIFDQIKSEDSKPKIKILSEKIITEPQIINANEMIPVSPSKIINAPKQSLKPELLTNTEQQTKDVWDPKESSEKKVLPYEIIINNNIQNFDNMPIVFLDENNTLIPLTNNSGANAPMMITAHNENPNIEPHAQCSPTKKSDSLLKTNAHASPGPKSKIPPERVAAIEEKRNFNKKLRDMIEFCLDELDGPEKEANKSKKHNLKSPATQSNVKSENQSASPKSSNTKLSSAVKNGILQRNKRRCNVAQKTTEKISLSQTGSTPVIQEHTLASLEARLAEMEGRLAQKIEKNTQQISELNDYVTSQETLFSQTPTEHEEVFKKRLYKEISKFLSPNANSLIYEELFINNKFGTNVPDATSNDTHATRSAKRRKRR